ncbi:RrF2 family transcriptional regulator [Lentilactobacillus farraginis]|uniref:Transcriptional regulator n=1 Tax=Lentilactobacillus farraginis DSM 18382 = JCM 14108 TaxID=1423743 RepID=X0QC58_9LACO|nr:Rrf2 family transcriptional regulator [Lentilactobacillus farraginis]KRM01768.1 transcriptional regulator [Lentilactobacillus farraginis DSM 18382 = JCM 14108]GAF36200.1 Rrf2 family transcriptional regulator [Lentilactobacillus farraginis DSM 18382 = JCM 14108]
MKLKSSFEQAVCILLMLALSKNHMPLRSAVISNRLGVSDSYLKKVLHQMVVGGLISSEAGKGGGFSLCYDINRMTLLDIYNAIEGSSPLIKPTGIARQVFFDGQFVEVQEEKIFDQIGRAETQFKSGLKKENLGTLLINPDGTHRQPIDWNQVGDD